MAKKRLRSVLHIFVKHDRDLYGDVRKTVNDARSSTLDAVFMKKIGQMIRTKTVSSLKIYYKGDL